MEERKAKVWPIVVVAALGAAAAAGLLPDTLAVALRELALALGAL